MRAHPLPPLLFGSPFAVERGLDAGLTLNRMNASDLDATVWGVRDAAGSSTDISCARFAARLHHGAYWSHSTAALLFGVPLPVHLELAAELHVSVRAPSRAPHAEGLRGHALTLSPGEVGVYRRHRVTMPERTWCDLASQLNLLNLVAAGDALLHGKRPLCSIERLIGCLDRHPLLKNGALARQALALLDGAAESRPESFVRVIAVLAGLPHPFINHSLIDTELGSVVRPDFEFRQYRTLVEYQGDYHRLTKAQWRKDMTRRSRLEAKGWTVIEINADDLRDANELMTRIAASLRRNGWAGRLAEVFAQIVW